jgi:hypothetical protein
LTNGAFSSAGTAWTQTGTIGFGTKASVFASGLYVVAGQNGQGAFSGALTSAFTTITQTETGWTGTGPTAYINAGAYGQGSSSGTSLFVFGGGSGRLAYTPTITSGGAVTRWATASTNPFGLSEFINAIVFGNGTFVAVGGPNSGQGRIAYSTNGINWTNVTNPPIGQNSPIFGLAYGSYGGTNYFVAGDDAGYSAYSTNGVNWVAIPVPVFASGAPINAIAYGNGKFVAVGGNSASGPQAAYTP